MLEQLLTADVGLSNYRDCYKIQEAVHEACKSGRLGAGALLMTEHRPVLTLGKNADESFLLNASQGIDVVRTDRGGEVTAHMPGQMVVYPILPLGKYRLLARAYVELLQASVIELLNFFEIPAELSPDYPGVWVADEKICAVGVRIRERISMHGIALNVCNELDLFGKIVPCGISNRGVTSMSMQRGATLSVAEVWTVYKKILSKALRAEGVEATLDDVLGT
jgi:lipoate-protein ligase B